MENNGFEDKHYGMSNVQTFYITYIYQKNIYIYGISTNDTYYCQKYTCYSKILFVFRNKYQTYRYLLKTFPLTKVGIKNL